LGRGREGIERLGWALVIAKEVGSNPDKPAEA